MAKKNLIALAVPLFASYHKVNVFHFTSDECPFFDDYSAKNHASTLADKTITPVTREEVFENGKSIVRDEANAAYEYALKFDVARNSFKDLFGFDAPFQLNVDEIDAAILCHNLFVDQLRSAYIASTPEGVSINPNIFKIVAVPMFDLAVNSINDDHAYEQISAFINTDNQPAPTNNDVASDAAGTVQQQAPAAKPATEEKPATVKKPKAPKAKPAVEPVATEQAEKPASEQSADQAAEQPGEQAAEQPTENN